MIVVFCEGSRGAGEGADKRSIAVDRGCKNRSRVAQGAESGAGVRESDNGSACRTRRSDTMVVLRSRQDRTHMSGAVNARTRTKNLRRYLESVVSFRLSLVNSTKANNEAAFGQWQ